MLPLPKALPRLACTVAIASLLFGVMLRPCEGQKPAHAAMQPVTDGQIAGALLAAASMSIPNGALALERSSDLQIAGYARVLVEERTSLVRTALLLTRQINAEPIESELSTRIVERATRLAAQVAMLHGREFDLAFLRAESVLLDELRTMIDDVLLPGAREARLRTLLVEVRSAAEHDLDRVLRIASSLAQ